MLAKVLLTEDLEGPNSVQKIRMKISQGIIFGTMSCQSVHLQLLLEDMHACFRHHRQILARDCLRKLTLQCLIQRQRRGKNEKVRRATLGSLLVSDVINVAVLSDFGFHTRTSSTLSAKGATRLFSESRFSTFCDMQLFPRDTGKVAILKRTP